MTIKPLINQKSNEKKESSHGHQEATTVSSNVRANHRNVLGNKSTVEGQSPQRRSDVFEDLTRHRRSPHKSSSSVRAKRDHVKREKGGGGGGVRSGSPQYHPSSVALHSPHASSSCGVSNKSPKHGLLTGTGTAPLQSANSLLNPEETFSGYNSGDEHLVPKETLLTADEWKSRDEQFTKALSERGFIIQDIVEDGACLFRAISLQIYGDQEMHEVIRQQAMDYIYQNREYFAHFVTEDITSYIKRKRNKESHGNHIEIQAMSEIYNRPVELYCYQTTPTNIFNSEQINNGYDPLRLSYQRGSHYNAIIDPYNASVGVGLGLAGYKPESQTHEAIRLSEQLEIEKTMFEDKLKTTDWEATNEAIEEQIARESYLQWCRDNIPGSDSSKTTTTTTSTSSSSSSSSTSSCSSSGLAASNSTATVTSAANLDPCTPSNSKDHQSSDTNSKSADLQQVMADENDVATSECYESDSTDLSGSASSSTSSLSRPKKSTKFGNSSSSSCPTRRLKRRHRDLKDPPKKCGGPADTSAIDGSGCLHKRVKQLKKSTIDADSTAKHNQQHPLETFTNYGSLPCTSKQATTQIDQPLSSFYQSLLESSYADDGIGQLSENEMVMKALRMSRIDFFESANCQHGEDANVYSCDENGNNTGGGRQVETNTVSDNSSKNFTSIRNYQADDDSDVPSP